MNAIFPTIIAVLVGLSFEEFYAETAMPEEPLARLLAALPICLLPWLAGEVLFFFARRRFAGNRPFDHRRYAKWIMLAPLPLYCVILFVFDWPKILVHLRIEGTVLIDHLVTLLPYFGALACALIQSARLRRPLREDENRRPAALAEVRPVLLDTVRQLGLILVPLFGLILLLDLVSDTSLRLYFHHIPLLSSLFLLVVFFALALLYPLLFRVGMGLKPLVKGAPLRHHLERLSNRLGFRCRDILYWSSSRPVLNAAIVGVLPRYRYVILTEELCKRLTLEELGAVFAHEVGHGKRHHAFYYLLFALAFLAVLVPIGNVAGQAIENASDGRVDQSVAAALAVYLPAFVLAWVLLFSFLSRRFELEADVYGVESSNDPILFIATLEKVARVAHLERRRRATRHFSIEGRADFLRRAFVEREEGLLEGFQRRIRTIRRTIAAAALGVSLIAGGWLGLESMRGFSEILLEWGHREDAQRLLDGYVTLRSHDEIAHTLQAEASLVEDMPPAPAAEFAALLADPSRLAIGERYAVLDTLRSGWGRAIAQSRLECAAILLEWARSINLDPAREGGRFDLDVDNTLFEMATVTNHLNARDRNAIEALMEHPPRWLRRADMRTAHDHLLRLATDHKDI